MKTIYLLLVLVCNCGFYNIKAQESEFVQKLITNSTAIERAKWNRNLTNILTKTNAINVYQDLVEEINRKISTANSLNKIAQYINPNDKSLTGQSYNEFIAQKADFYFVKDGGKTKDELDDENGKRVQGILANLTDEKLNGQGTVSIIGGIVNGFISSTPVLNVATKVIAGISTFFKSTKAGGKVVGISETIKKEKLQEFQNNLKPYIEFYDGALKFNMEFGYEIERTLAIANKLDIDSKNASNSLKEYVKNITGNEAFDYIDIQEEYPFDFEKSYFNLYDKEYYRLIQKVDSIEMIYLKASDVSKDADYAINAYLKSMNKLVHDFTGKIIKNDQTHVDLSVIQSEIDEYKDANSIASTGDDSSGDLKFISIKYMPEDYGQELAVSLIGQPVGIVSNSLISPKVILIALCALAIVGGIILYLLNKQIHYLKTKIEQNH